MNKIDMNRIDPSPAKRSTELPAARPHGEPRVTVNRYSVFTRINHWTLATCFVLLSLSGLALFHPSLYWLSNLQQHSLHSWGY